MNHLQDFAQLVWFATLQTKPEETKKIVCEGIDEEYHEAVMEVLGDIIGLALAKELERRKENDRR